MSQNQTESPPTARELKDKIRGRSAKAGVVGLGYVGLPLAMEMAHTGFQVTGIDLVKEKVDSVNSGTSYVLDVASEALRSAVSANRMRSNPISGCCRSTRHPEHLCADAPTQEQGS